MFYTYMLHITASVKWYNPNGSAGRQCNGAQHGGGEVLHRGSCYQLTMPRPGPPRRDDGLLGFLVIANEIKNHSCFIT
jgi:hypothetical protein